MTSNAVDQLVQTICQPDSYSDARFYEVGHKAVRDLCCSGTGARVRGIRESYPIHAFDPNRRLWVVSFLTGGNASQWGSSLAVASPIPEEAIDALTTSSRYEDWWCYFELSFKFAECVSRSRLKDGFLQAYARGDSDVRSEIAYWMKKRGFYKFGPLWF